MEMLDARRLTGPNVLMDGPGTVLDIGCTEGERPGIAECWRHTVERMVADLGWRGVTLHERRLAGGVSLAFTAPIDVLYAATALNEYAFEVCAAAGDNEPSRDYATALADLQNAAGEEANPDLLALAAAADEHGVTLLWDDDEVSLGTGRTARRWPARELPAPATVSWSSFSDVPTALITGTNGKTTTARLARHIVSCAALVPGLCSTDWVAVGDEIVERGDWSGPGGARTVLRHPSAQVAVLEAARGGLLRRGLGVARADAALITNIAEDHLGDFGSRSLDELLDIKWVVSHAVRDSGTLVLNADDARLVERARHYDGELAWFGLDADSAVVSAALARGGLAYLLSGDELLRVEGEQRTAVCRVADMPIALGGAARHNVANALAAAALCDRLGLPIAAIRAGLASMTPADNPGRCNIFDLPHCRVLVDFAHNPHAMQALFAMAQVLPAARRILAFGQAGDRTDAQIRELAQSAWAIGLEHVVVSELAEYSRGRAAGEVYGLIRDALQDAGARDDQLSHCQLETEALDTALAHARPGDLVIMLALGDSSGVRRRLDDLAGRT